MMVVVLPRLEISVSPDDLVASMEGNGASGKIGETIEIIAARVSEEWTAGVVYGWLDLISTDDRHAVFSREGGTRLTLEVGRAAEILTKARRVLFAAYTLGPEPDREIGRLSREGKHLEAYVYDCAAVAALEQAARHVREAAETEAARWSWGVSPVLSPGSVKGWEMDDQIRLCSVLPLDRIGLVLNDQGILLPFKSVSCVIGIGPGYEASWAGSTCMVCNHAEACALNRMKNI